MEDFVNNLRNIFSNIGTAASAIGSVVSGNPAMLVGNLAARGSKDALGYKTPGELTVDKAAQAVDNIVAGNSNSEGGKNVVDALYDKMKDAYDKRVAEEEAKKEETNTTSEDTVEYEYKPGDTFGQVLLDLGVSDGSNLWGPAGDVAYYTEQLREQDMLDANGNVKLGKKFKLKKRPAGV